MLTPHGPKKKTVVDNYLANSGSPITYGEFACLMEEHRAEIINGDAIESQKAALKNIQH